MASYRRYRADTSLTATGILIADGVLAFICVLKDKYRTGLFGLFLPPVGVIGALRLARP